MKGRIVIELLGDDKLSVEIEARMSEEDKVQILMSLAQSLSDRDADKTVELLNKTGFLAVTNMVHPVNEMRVVDKAAGTQINSDFLKFLEGFANGKERS